MDLPDWLPAWCRERLGAEPAAVLFDLRQMSRVIGLRLSGGDDVVVKVRDDDGRAAACVAAQYRLAERGHPCARPLTAVDRVGPLAVHAERLCPGGDVLRGDSPDAAVRYAEVSARPEHVSVAPPLPSPRWDHTESRAVRRRLRRHRVPRARRRGGPVERVVWIG